MKNLQFLGLTLMVGLASFLAGCSTRDPVTANRFDHTANGAQANPVPTASPSQRPGMNSQDPRDAQFVNRPDPSQPGK